MKKILLLIVLFILIFMFSVSSFAQDKYVEKESVDIAAVSCDQNTSLFILQYIQENDDFFSQPKLPKICRLSKSKYKVFGGRGPFSETGLCGAEPPVSITLTRNDIVLVSDAVFGGNCFGGPSIAEIEITEKNGKIIAIKLCIFKEHESPVAEGDKFEPVCKYFRGKEEIKKILPISQSNLGDIISGKIR